MHARCRQLWCPALAGRRRGAMAYEGYSTIAICWLRSAAIPRASPMRQEAKQKLHHLHLDRYLSCRRLQALELLHIACAFLYSFGDASTWGSERRPWPCSQGSTGETCGVPLSERTRSLPRPKILYRNGLGRYDELRPKNQTRLFPPRHVPLSRLCCMRRVRPAPCTGATVKRQHTIRCYHESTRGPLGRDGRRPMVILCLTH